MATEKVTSPQKIDKVSVLNSVVFLAPLKSL